MSALTCHFGMARAVDLPAWLTEGNGQRVVDALRTASNGRLGLTIQTRLTSALLSAGDAEVGSFDLHTALRRLVGIPARPVDAIGVVLARRYRYGGIFGIMFDKAFDLDVPAEGQAPSLAGPPREGCAVFLDEIASRREPGYETSAQSLFTTVHELGHVFNLQHDDAHPCFMCQSAYSTTYDQNHFRFTAAQSFQLQRAAPVEPSIWPGGSPFGDYDAEDGQSERGHRRAPPVRVALHVARTQFHPFEPLELDIEVSLAKGRKRAVDIPDVIDPGYEQFRLWIEDPKGERRWLRSPRLYCSSGAQRRIDLGAAFSRDVSVFGESGGYTFRRAGPHRIWAELHLPGCRPIRSNEVAFDVLPTRTRSAAEDSIMFSDSAVRTLLYHRIYRHRGRAVRLLGEWLQRRRHHPAAPTVRFALAKALFERFARSPRPSRPDVSQQISRLLERAEDDHRLGRNQREKCGHYLNHGSFDGIKG